jgi:hypothetical protein
LATCGSEVLVSKSVSIENNRMMMKRKIHKYKLLKFFLETGTLCRLKLEVVVLGESKIKDEREEEYL